jgi:hypothetical protein
VSLNLVAIRRTRQRLGLPERARPRAQQRGRRSRHRIDRGAQQSWQRPGTATLRRHSQSRKLGVFVSSAFVRLRRDKWWLRFHLLTRNGCVNLTLKTNPAKSAPVCFQKLGLTSGRNRARRLKLAQLTPKVAIIDPKSENPVQTGHFHDQGNYFHDHKIVFYDQGKHFLNHRNDFHDQRNGSDDHKKVFHDHGNHFHDRKNDFHDP